MKKFRIIAVMAALLSIGMSATAGSNPQYTMRVPIRGLGSTSSNLDSDPYWSKVVALLHLDGTNGSTSILDQKGGAYSAASGATLSTVSSMFGGASAYFPGTAGNVITGPAISLTGDFTVESWVNLGTTTGVNTIVGQWNQSGSQGGYALRVDNGKATFGFGAYTELSVMMTSTATISPGSWYHIAATRSGSTFRLFVNGTQSATATYAGAGRTLSVPLTIGQYYSASGTFPATGTNNFHGYIDDLRITNGVARYTTNFTVPTSAFPNQ